MCQLEDLIGHLLRGTRTVNACVSEFMRLLQEMLKELRLSPNKVSVRRVLREPIVQSVQRLQGRLLERRRPTKLISAHMKRTERMISMVI